MVDKVKRQWSDHSLIKPGLEKYNRGSVTVLQNFLEAELASYSVATSFSPVCEHKVIVHDATAKRMSRTHIMELMENITL